MPFPFEAVWCAPPTMVPIHPDAWCLIYPRLRLRGQTEAEVHGQIPSPGEGELRWMRRDGEDIPRG